MSDHDDLLQRIAAIDARLSEVHAAAARIEGSCGMCSKRMDDLERRIATGEGRLSPRGIVLVLGAVGTLLTVAATALAAVLSRLLTPQTPQ